MYRRIVSEICDCKGVSGKSWWIGIEPSRFTGESFTFRMNMGSRSAKPSTSLKPIPDATKNWVLETLQTMFMMFMTMTLISLMGVFHSDVFATRRPKIWFASGRVAGMLEDKWFYQHQHVGYTGPLDLLWTFVNCVTECDEVSWAVVLQIYKNWKWPLLHGPLSTMSSILDPQFMWEWRCR